MRFLVHAAVMEGELLANVDVAQAEKGEAGYGGANANELRRQIRGARMIEKAPHTAALGRVNGRPKRTGQRAHMFDERDNVVGLSRSARAPARCGLLR